MDWAFVTGVRGSDSDRKPLSALNPTFLLFD